MSVFTPIVDANEAFGEGDWRPILGDAARHSDVKVHFIGKSSIEAQLEGVILPCFDYSLNLEDTSFQGSVAPCWSSVPDPNNGRHLQPTSWGLPIMMYPYLGPSKEHWISPANRRNMIGRENLTALDSADAFDDLNKWVRRNKAFTKEFKDSLLVAKSMNEDAPIPGKTIRYASNTKTRDKDSSELHRSITLYTASAHSYLVEQLRWLHQDKCDPRDPNWPNYMLGDVTDPAGAVVWHVSKVRLDPKDTQETNVMCFTKRREFLDSPQVTLPITQADLDARILLPDPNSWNIPTYEEQVKYMIAHYDGLVTMDMIRAACGHFCTFELPSSRPENITVHGGGAQSDGNTAARDSEPRRDSPAPATASGGMTPKSTPPAPMSAPATRPPQAAPSAPAVTYFAGKGGGKPEKYTVEELQEMFDSGAAEGFKVLLTPPNGWVLLVDSGLVRLPEASVPDDTVPSIPEDDAPTVPSDTAPSVPADAPTASQASAGIPLEAMKAKLFPSSEVLDALGPDKQAEAEALIQEAWVATDYGTKDLPGAIVDRLVLLLS